MAEVEDFDILWISRIGETETLREYLHKNPSLINSKDENENNIFHMAAANGHLDIIMIAISFNSSSTLLNSQNSQGNTPLHWAVLNKRYDVISTLMQHGAKISIENVFNETAIDLAIKSDNSTALSIFEKMTDCGSGTNEA